MPLPYASSRNCPALSSDQWRVPGSQKYFYINASCRAVLFVLIPVFVRGIPHLLSDLTGLHYAMLRIVYNYGIQQDWHSKANC